MFKKKFREICTLLVVIIAVQLIMPINVHAQKMEDSLRASDTVSRSCSKTFSYIRNYESKDTDGIIEDSQITTINFKVRLDSALQYDRLTGSYVSCSTPTATIIQNYNANGHFTLSLHNVSFSKVDNGTSITFSYNATVIGVLDPGGLITKLNYGDISGSFTVNK